MERNVPVPHFSVGRAYRQRAWGRFSLNSGCFQNIVRVFSGSSGQFEVFGGPGFFSPYALCGYALWTLPSQRSLASCVVSLTVNVILPDECDNVSLSCFRASMLSICFFFCGGGAGSKKLICVTIYFFISLMSWGPEQVNNAPEPATRISALSLTLPLYLFCRLCCLRVLLASIRNAKMQAVGLGPLSNCAESRVSV